MIRIKIKVIVLIASYFLSSGELHAESHGDLLGKIGEDFGEVLKFADAKLWSKAEEGVNQIGNEISFDIVRWLKLRNGVQNFAEYELFLSFNSNWPGIDLLRQKGEQAIDSSVSLERLKNYFSNEQPSTAHGALKLAQAYLAEGKDVMAEKTIVNSWLSHSFSRKDFATVQKLFERTLSYYNNERADNLLWSGRLDDVQQMIFLLDNPFRQLVETRMALQKHAAGVDNLIKKLPIELKNDPGLAFDRFRFRRAKGLTESAERLLLQKSDKKDNLGRPKAWAKVREIFARNALLRGDINIAYKLASEHRIDFSNYQEIPELADLEWLAGFIAFEFLKDNEKALIHFNNFSMFVINPVNKSKASYWIGRTYDNLNQTELAQKAYRKGARYQTYFYGQLAAERSNFPVDVTLIESSGRYNWESMNFVRNSTIKAAILLYYSGRSVLADRFFNHASENLTKFERLQLSQLVCDIGLVSSGVSLSKTAALSGIFLPNFSFPIMPRDLFAKADLIPISTAIIRQESGFFSLATSKAGAIGLMQLMPGTAKFVARKLNISYSIDRLARDKKYNILLGSNFLKMLLKQFDGSKILAISSYNAGPSRVRDWLTRFGDPRSKGIDPLVWIELIPFSETRNYVKRVIESEWVYEGKYGGKLAVIDIGKRSFGHSF